MSEGLRIAECRLDPGGLRTQRERYRELAGAVCRLERNPGELLVEFAAGGVDERLLEETLATERECCPFFEIHYDPAERRLRLGVEDPGRDAALDAIAYAFGGPEPTH